ncbi:MAG: RIP metalloprotease RseP [Bradymonadaceae bacterium]|nr:RIP metalloprotease RseP [Lujinxingiaceae bacterium]
MSLIYFVILIGVLIFVHEFGHYIVAKAFDVKVLRFSIGFGPKVIGYTRGDTEYVLCALPLGGYVQMLGADLESVEEMEEEDRARALMSKPIWQRSLIVLAGPVFNLILPVVIYFVVGMGQSMTPPAIIGEVFVDSPAATAGLAPGDRIVEIDGRSIDYWHQVVRTVSAAYDRPIPIVYERDGARHTTEAVPDKKTSTDFLGLERRTYGMLGIHLGTHGTTVALSDRAGPGAEAGLQFFDRIVAIDGVAVQRFDHVQSRIRNSAGKPLELVVLRRMPMPADWATLYAQRLVTLTATPAKIDGAYSLGIEAAEMYLTHVDENSPVARAGLQPGDKLVALDGETYNNWSVLIQRIHNTINQQIVTRDEEGDKDRALKPSFEIGFERAGERLSATLEPDVLSFHDDNKQQRYRVVIGWGHFRDVVYPEDVPFPFFGRMVHSAREGFNQTADFCKMMLVGFVRLAQGRVSMESIGGPIMIGELAGQAGRAGWEPFLQMMALISINLAIINLLPIPVLDGGHLLLFALEAIKRGPLSYRTRQIAAYIGFTMIVFLMIFAFKNDIERNWHRVVEYFDEG